MATRRKRRSIKYCGGLAVCSLFTSYVTWLALQRDSWTNDDSPTRTLLELQAAHPTDVQVVQDHTITRGGSQALHAVPSSAVPAGIEPHANLIVVTEPPFLARSDGGAIVTDALQRAIDVAGATIGGAEVMLPAGIYLTGSLFLRSNVTLRLAAGARIQAIAPPQLWESCKKNKQGQFVTNGACNRSRFDTWASFPSVYVPDLQWDVGGFQHAAVLNGGRCKEVLEPASAYGDRCVQWEKLENVAIVGSGPSSVIDGAGDLWWKCCPKMPAAPGAFTGPCPDDCNRDTQRPKLIHMLFVDNLTISNFTAQNSAFWTIVPQYSTNVHVQSLKIRAPPHSHNTDGVDPQSCLNVTIQDLDISTGDDCIAVYAGSNLQGRKLAYPTNHVRINRVLCRKGHGMSVGSRTAGGISDVVFSNISCWGTDTCVRMKTCRGRGGLVRNISFVDVEMKNAKEAIRIDMQYEYHKRTNASATPRIQAVTVRNVKGTARAFGEIRGLVEAPAEVHLEQIDVAAKGKLLCSEAKVKIQDVSMKVKEERRCSLIH